MARDNFLDKRGLGYLWGKITNKIATSETNITAKIPKKTSQLENDSNFAKKTDIPAPSQSMPKSPTASGAVGTGTRYSREDHQHPKQPLNEAEIKWGGGSISGGVSPIDAAIIPMVGYNKTECAKPEGIIIEYSNDAGATWIDYGLSDTIKSGLVSMCGNNSVYIGGGTTLTQKTLDDKLRITVNATKCETYTELKKILIEISSNGAQNITVYIEKAKGTAPTEFSEVGTYSISGWSGWNSIDIGKTYFGGGSESNIFVLRFTFSIGGLNTSGYTNALQIMHILFIGNTSWRTPSVMAKSGHLYTYNTKQDATFPANVAATSFTGSGNGLTTSFESAAARQNIKSGENLTTIFGKITRMFTDLKGLAFKDKVDKTDLSDAVQVLLTKADSALDDAKAYTNTKVSEHNQDTAAHTDIRTELGKKETVGAAAGVQTNLNAHASNINIHVTAEEKAKIANAVPGGYGYGEELSRIGHDNITDAEFVEMLEAKLSTMGYNSAAQVMWEDHPLISGTTFIGTLWKSGDGKYATLTGNGYASLLLIRVKVNGVWQPFEWINPPMQPGVEYRTTERRNGWVVYKKLDTDGIIKWRVDGETTWNAAVTYGTSDLTAGTSALPTGELYVVYE